MAEFGAHLTVSLGELPSIFEVLACDGLSKGLRAAFKHFSKVLVENNPERYNNLSLYSEEIYTVLDFVVQTYHLFKYNASFSENFYGLKRTASKINPVHISKSSLYKSLALLVLFPYLSEKLEKKYIQLKEEESHSNGSRKRDLVKILSLVFFTAKMAETTYKFTYAVGRGKYHSPLIHLAGCQLRTLTQSDIDNFKTMDKVAYTNWALINFCINSFGKFASVLTTGISIGAFFLQFLEWWYSQEDRPKNFGSLPVPNPPSKIESLRSGICPICERKIKNTTLLSTSGIVYCYRCIHESLSYNAYCPVTRYPATLSQLIKLYPPTD